MQTESACSRDLVKICPVGGQEWQASGGLMKGHGVDYLDPGEGQGGGEAYL